MRKILRYLLLLILPCLLFSCARKNTDAVSAMSSSAVMVTENINGAEIAKYSTEHFDFCSFDQDTSYLEDLGTTLEDNYLRIITNLGAQISEKTPVFIYPDLDAFHNAVRDTDIPDWAVGTAWGKNIYMVSPNNARTQTYDEMKKVIVHEFVHVVELYMRQDAWNLPKWLWEGTATYEAAQMPRKISTTDVPTLEDLSKEAFFALDGYQYSYTIIEFLVGQYGYEKLQALITSPDEIETELGVSEDTFYTEWTNYLKEHY